MSKVRAPLTLVRDLVAVTDNVNQSNGNQDPAGWMPPATPAACRYVAEWTAVRIRWRPPRRAH